MTNADNLPKGPAAIYDRIKGAAIVSPHGHCDPAWFATNARFADPAALIIIPDHYVFRLLYSHGIALDQLGIGVDAQDRNPRTIWRIFAAHWHLFLGTPSRWWITHMLRNCFGIDTPLTSDTADAIYDLIDAALAHDDFRPRALFERFGIECLATTDSATDDLHHHRAISQGDWAGRVIPTFRPDILLNPLHPDFAPEMTKLQNVTAMSVTTFADYLSALRQRRQFFKDNGATATDHGVETLATTWLDPQTAQDLFAKAMTGTISPDEAQIFQGHMLTEMAQMSVDDGLVMQIHAGSTRNTHARLLNDYGRDMGADIPQRTDWVGGLGALLNHVGMQPGFRLIAFTLDETTYARELAPMAGHWPCLRIGPPWWFHDSANGIARYFDRVVETAGYFNLAGFNDDTRAFLSIPARHDLWRRGVAIHLSAQMDRGVITAQDADMLARYLTVGAARDTYRLGSA